MKLDLNCDLGEGEPRARTEALMRVVTSANIASGGHAGTATSMRLCLQLARQYGVKPGAHPGPENTHDFGRGPLDITPAELELLLLKQVSAFSTLAREVGMRLHHLKLHGALYHAVEAKPNLAREYLKVVARNWPRVKIYARANGLVARMATQTAVTVWPEAFLDRGYQENGFLVPRSEAGALLTNVPDVIARLRRLQTSGQIDTIGGHALLLRPRTLCIHSDTPQAIKLARYARRQTSPHPAINRAYPLLPTDY